MIQLSKPNWLKERLGSVKEYFGEQSNIEIDRIEYNRVFLNINQYIFPASFDLSNLIINQKIELDDLLNYEVLELASGEIVISQVFK